jgi:glyoxylase-like metal-dependent hydrolase (beta-lactamase superfamily II)
MQPVVPGVHASPPAPLPFGEAIEIRAFLLQRPAGNLLLHGAPTMSDEARAVEELGGVARHYLGHWHEAMFAKAEFLVRQGVALLCHEADRQQAEEHVRVTATFTERHRPEPDFEAIPMPGHTEGSTAYLWDSGRHRCLFTADSIYLHDGEWIAAVLRGSSDREAYLASLAMLRELEFDVLVPWAASRGQPFHAMTDRKDARRRIGAILDRLRRGEDH